MRDVSPPDGRRLGIAGCVALLCLLCAFPARAEEDAPRLEYHPGRRLHDNGTGLSLAGYTDIEAQRPEGGRAEFTLDELAIFVRWDVSQHWHFFSETELAKPLAIDERGRTETIDDVRLDRLYLDYSRSDPVNVRVGKFLTPMGIWNVVHAEPLVPTVSRPIATTNEFFDQFTSGLMFYGTQAIDTARIDYSLYGQPTDQIVPAESDIRTARRAAGGRAQLSTGRAWTLGFSSSAQDNEVQRRWEYVSGVDFKWECHWLEVWNEFVANTPVHGQRPTDWALYSQAVAPLRWGLYAVGRYEHARRDGDVNAGVIGVVYRPIPSVVVKAQYLFSDRRSFSDALEPGFAAQVAVLF